MADVTSENPHGYWCRPCGRSRAHAEKHCSSAYCRERRDEEDRDRECPRDHAHLHLWRPSCG